MKMKTRQDNTGIAPSDSRWTAIDDDTYDGPGSPIGAGATEAEAIADLLAEIAPPDTTRRGLQQHDGQTFSATGKFGTRIATGEEAAEYENVNATGERVWVTAGGEAYPD